MSQDIIMRNKFMKQNHKKQYLSCEICSDNVHLSSKNFHFNVFASQIIQKYFPFIFDFNKKILNILLLYGKSHS